MFSRTHAAALALGFALASGCGGDDDAGSSGDAGGAPLPAAGCVAEGETMHELMSADHLTDISGVRYSSNPPSSGPHCPAAGQYGVYDDSPRLPRCNWIHNLEHGAVVLLYNCPKGCPETVAALVDVMRLAANDPDCGARKRLILTPDPQLDVPVAAAAWGFTWKASCLDEAGKAALVRFVDAHLGSRGIAPEVAPGRCL